jgi:hypothetical protein
VCVCVCVCVLSTHTSLLIFSRAVAAAGQSVPTTCSWHSPALAAQSRSCRHTGIACSLAAHDGRRQTTHDEHTCRRWHWPHWHCRGWACPCSGVQRRSARRAGRALRRKSCCRAGRGCSEGGRGRSAESARAFDRVCRARPHRFRGNVSFTIAAGTSCRISLAMRRARARA